MKKYIVELTEAEDKALSVVAFSQQEWIDNMVHERCRVAMDEIIQAEVQRKLAIGESINGTRDDVVLGAEIETVAEKNARLQKEYEEFQENKQG